MNQGGVACVHPDRPVMRASRLILLSLVVAALAVSGCMRRPGPPMVAAPVLAEPTVIAAPPVVVAAPAVPLIEEPVDGPYILDAGDKLRVVVFGQENLSNSYAVDAAGRITMPLIGAV